jgi:hypothetical protein
MKTQQTLNERAKNNLLRTVRTAPVTSIGFFFLNISIKNPAHSFAMNDRKVTVPSSRPNDLVVPPSSSTIKMGRREKIMEVAMPQKRCIPQIQTIVE